MPTLEDLDLLQDSQCVEEMSCACWDFVLELRRGRRSLGYSREAVVEMVNAMLMRGSPALGFIRKVGLQSFLPYNCNFRMASESEVPMKQIDTT